MLLLLGDNASVLSGGSRISQMGALTQSLERKPIWKDFFRKLYENERNWTERGTGLLPRTPLGPPMVFDNDNPSCFLCFLHCSQSGALSTSLPYIAPVFSPFLSFLVA